MPLLHALTLSPFVKIGVGFTNGTMKLFKLELQKGRLMHGAKRKQKKRKGKVRKKDY